MHTIAPGTAVGFVQIFKYIFFNNEIVTDIDIACNEKNIYIIMLYGTTTEQIMFFTP